MARRREQVLDAAVRVLGNDGMRRLTYQAVDAAAGAPAGTTSNYFRNRDALLDGIVAHLETLDRRDWESLATAHQPDTVPRLVDALHEFVGHATGPAVARTAARYALLLEARANPRLRVPFAHSHAQIVEWGARWIARLGSGSPEAHCRTVLDYLDGLILRRITMADQDRDPKPEIHAVLAGVLGEL